VNNIFNIVFIFKVNRMVVVSKYVDDKEYDPEDLKHLQELLLMILNDFITFCDDHEITYFIDGGSTLGCVRHQGFIPWDDDIDVTLFRDQYDKFLEYRDEFDDKYEILNMEDYDKYCRIYSKISLKGTKTGEIFDRNTNFTYGISIDVFVFDNIPNPGLKRELFVFQFRIFRRFLGLYEITNADIYLSRTKEIIGHFVIFLFKILHIDNNTVKKYGKKIIEKSKELDSDYVCSLGTPYGLYAFDKSIFESSIKSKFESIEVNLAQDYERYLNINFGEDWRELPPVEERHNHKYVGFDFGKY